MSETIVRSIVRISIGHVKAGILHFNAYGLNFSIEKLQKTSNTYAIMAETSDPFCIGYVTA